MYHIDTVVLSELRKPQRDPGVVAWFEQQRTADLFVSVVSIGEIEQEIARQTHGGSGLCRGARCLARGCSPSTATGSCHSISSRRAVGVS